MRGNICWACSAQRCGQCTGCDCKHGGFTAVVTGMLRRVLGLR